jgi:hypothetical protein
MLRGAEKLVAEGQRKGLSARQARPDGQLLPLPGFAERGQHQCTDRCAAFSPVGPAAWPAGGKAGIDMPGHPRRCFKTATLRRSQCQRFQ